jgi:hypothetical protein
MKYRQPVILSCIFLLIFAFACNRADVILNPCLNIFPRDGLYRCNGKLIHPTLGTLYYQGVYRYFHTYGPRDFQHQYSFINSLGITDSLNIFPITTFSFTDYSVVVSDATGTVKNPIPNVNRFDTCSGILYIKYSWSNGTRTVCDTCFF